jgi:hypothetical protein
MRIKRKLGLGMLVVCSLAWAQAPKPPLPFDQPDAQRTREELSRLLEHYPPSVRAVLGVDPGLLGNQPYLATYPALASYLSNHPEIAHNPSFYIPAPMQNPFRSGNAVADAWKDVMGDLTIVLNFGMAVALLGWLIRTLVDYRRWNRLTSTQTEFHTKLVDRFTANNDLLSYVQSPAGARFLQSTPIALDAAPRSMGAPLGRILWSVQGGVVLIAAGIGLWIVGARIGGDASQPLQGLGVIAIALGAGFGVSAAISFLISRRLGLIETPTHTPYAS